MGYLRSRETILYSQHALTQASYALGEHNGHGHRPKSRQELWFNYLRKLSQLPA